MEHQLFFRETQSAPRMYGARSVVILDGWPFAGPPQPPALHLFDVGSGLAVGRIEVGKWHAQGGRIEGHVTTSNGREMVVAGLDDQAVRRWDRLSGERIGLDVTPAARVTAISSLGYADRTVLIVATWGGQVSCYDAESGVPVLGRVTLPQTVWSLCAYQVKGELVLAMGDDAGRIWHWVVGSGHPPAVFAAEHGCPVAGIRHTMVGGAPALVSWSGDTTVRVWDAATGDQISLWISPASLGSAGISGVEILGEELLIGYADAVARVDPVTGAGIGEAQHFADDVYGICLVETAGPPILIVSSDMVHRLEPPFDARRHESR